MRKPEKTAALIIALCMTVTLFTGCGPEGTKTAVTSSYDQGTFFGGADTAEAETGEPEAGTEKPVAETEAADVETEEERNGTGNGAQPVNDPVSAGFLKKTSYSAGRIPDGGVAVTDAASLNAALKEKAKFILFSDDITVTSPIETTFDLTIFGNGHSLIYDGGTNPKGLIAVSSGNLELDGLALVSGNSSRNLYINRDSAVSANACVFSGKALVSRGISIYNEGSLELTNILIRDAASASVSYQGIIYNGSGGSLTYAYGCEIDPQSYVYTGSVYNEGVFNMTGGIIRGVGSNSNRIKYGAAVTNSGEFNMAGGIISGCKNSEAVFTSGTFNMTGGKISENTATTVSGVTYNSVFSGGGVLVYGGTFNMYDGAEISLNRSYMGAGVGVYYTGSVFNMYGGSITENEAGIDPSETTFNENNGCGGGVGVYGGAAFNLSGGTISQNIAYIGDTAELGWRSSNEQSFSDTGLGGGIYVTEGTVNITGGTVTNNTSRYAPYSEEGGRGGGIYIMNPSGGSAKVNITGGAVKGNTSESGSGDDVCVGGKVDPIRNIICPGIGGSADLGDVLLSGSRYILGICEAFDGLKVSSLTCEGKTSTGAVIARYDEGVKSNPTDPDRLNFAGVSTLTFGSDKTELVIDLLDLARVTSVTIDDVEFTGKEADPSGLNAHLTFSSRWVVDAPGLSGLRSENSKDDTEVGRASIDLRGDNIRYVGQIKNAHFNITPMPLDSEGISVEFEDQDEVYISDGISKYEPKIRLLLDSRSGDGEKYYLKEGSDGDYTVSYGENRDPGTGYIYLNATDNAKSSYTGQRAVTFEIYEKTNADEITLNEAEISIPAEKDGKTVTASLSAAVSPEGAYGTPILWSSSDENVATVDPDGLVTAVSYGAAEITATADDSGKKSASCTVNVLFSDVAGSDVGTDEDYQYFYDPVYWAVEKGIIGHGPVEFGVGEKISKGEYLVMLWKYSGSPESSKYKNPKEVFSDLDGTDPGSDLYKAAAWGYSEKIVSGTTDEAVINTLGTATDGKRPSLCPGAWLSRADMTVMLWRTAGKPKRSGRMRFTDVTDSGYARGSDMYRAIMWITKENIAKGYRQEDGSYIYGLDKGCYREYAVTYLYRYSIKDKN